MCLHCSNINNTNNIAADYSVNKNNERIFSLIPVSSGDGGGGVDDNQFLRRVCYPTLWIGELRAQNQRLFMVSLVMEKIRVKSAHQMQKYEWWRHHLPVSLLLMSLLRSLQAMPNWGSNNHYFHDNTMYVWCACVVATLSGPLHFYWNDIVSTESVMNRKNTNWNGRTTTHSLREKDTKRIPFHATCFQTKQKKTKKKERKKTK